jgi:hypothetical protein
MELSSRQKRRHMQGTTTREKSFSWRPQEVVLPWVPSGEGVTGRGSHGSPEVGLDPVGLGELMESSKQGRHNHL